ncbi:MAG TPA: lipopolysaccharide kinase InaA family protein, partial [Blastococcus sp.]
MRFLFRPPADEAAGLLVLPWDQPLEEWDDEHLLEVPQRGISRHVVRFVTSDSTVYALKEIDERLARHEYALLTEFEEEGLPTVSVLGICVDRPDDLPAILVTRYLEYSMSYRYLFSSPRADHSAEQLIDTLVELLVRLHLAGVFWGDCSLSNTLFRPDAGSISAYMVDAETVERHPSLSPGQRQYDVQLAMERVAAELLDLETGGLLPDDIDPIEMATNLPDRYAALWDEV